MSRARRSLASGDIFDTGEFYWSEGSSLMLRLLMQ
jgi:hypothetical protein